MANILVVDDNVLVCESFQFLLQGQGHNVETLFDSKKVLEIFKENSFDLAIVDIYMPDVDGLETIQMIKATTPEIKIIAMSGKKRTPFDQLSAAEAYGAQFTLIKPASAPEVIEIVDKALAG